MRRINPKAGCRQFFAAKIRQLRLARNWSQERLAEELQTSQTAVGEWEHCTRWFSPEVLDRIVLTFKIGPEQLFGSYKDVVERQPKQEPNSQRGGGRRNISRRAAVAGSVG